MNNIKKFFAKIQYYFLNFVANVIYVVRTASWLERIVYISLLLSGVLVFVNMFGFASSSFFEVSMFVAIAPAAIVMGSIWTYCLVVFIGYLAKSSIINLYRGIRAKIALKKEYRELSKNSEGTSHDIIF